MPPRHTFSASSYANPPGRDLLAHKIANVQPSNQEGLHMAGRCIEAPVPNYLAHAPTMAYGALRRLHRDPDKLHLCCSLANP